MYSVLEIHNVYIIFSYDLQNIIALELINNNSSLIIPIYPIESFYEW